MMDAPQDLETLTAAMIDFVESQGWLDESSPKPQNQKNLAISLVLEAGEVLELFQWRDAAADRDALESELADVMLYLLQLASVSGIDLGAAVMKKLERNYRRDWPAQSDSADLEHRK